RPEPVATTIGRALERGIAERIVRSPRSRGTRELKLVRRELEGSVAVDSISDLVARTAKVAPVLVLIDEFGKNLEHFPRDQSDAQGDLYVLQELAEWASRADGIPLLLLTLQHLAFDEYVEGAIDRRRREFA